MLHVGPTILYCVSAVKNKQVIHKALAMQLNVTVVVLPMALVLPQYGVFTEVACPTQCAGLFHADSNGQQLLAMFGREQLEAFVTSAMESHVISYSPNPPSRRRL